MSDLTNQLGDYFGYVDEQQGAVDLVALRELVDQPLQPLAPTAAPVLWPRAWAVGTAAAAVIAFAVLVPLLLIAFGDEPDVATTVPPTTEATVPTTAAPTTTVPEAVTTTVPAPTTTESPITTLPAFPPLKESLSHGGEAWAVYLAAGLFDDPSLIEAAQLLQDLGFRSGVGDLGCDAGAAELVGLDPGEFWDGVGVYLETESDAEAFVAALAARGLDVAGWGLVYTYCLD